VHCSKSLLDSEEAQKSYSIIERLISIIWQNGTSLGPSMRFSRLFPLQRRSGIAVLTALLTGESPLKTYAKTTNPGFDQLGRRCLLSLTGSHCSFLS
jgi:hypothetical protein